MYLGLTGNRLQTQDAYRLGLIKSIIPSENIEKVIQCLFEMDLSNQAQEKIDHCLGQYKATIGKGEIDAHQATIKACFSQASVEDIFSALEKKGDDWSLEIRENLQAFKYGHGCHYRYLPKDCQANKKSPEMSRGQLF